MAAPALRHRNFRLFVLTQAVSLVGTHMQNLGQAWLLLALTGDPVVLGLAAAAQGLPVALLSLPGGVVVDRLPRRGVVIGTQAAMLGLALLLGALTLGDHVEAWHVVVLALLVGCVSALDMPARQAFVVEMVGPEDVASAVGLNSAVYNAARLAGPAVAGIAIAALTAATGDAVRASGVAFLANAASFGAVLAGLLLMREGDLRAAPRPGGPRTLRAVTREMGEGLAWLRVSAPVRTALLVPGAVAMIGANFAVLVPVFAKEQGLGADGLGLLLSMVGLGALVAALRIGLRGRAGGTALLGGALALGVADLGLGAGGLLGVVLLAPLLLFAAGAGTSAMRTAANAIVQVETPAHLRGRVGGLFAIVFEGASPMGGLLAGGLAAALGGAGAFAVSGLAVVALALAGARGLRATGAGRAAATGA